MRRLLPLATLIPLAALAGCGPAPAPADATRPPTPDAPKPSTPVVAAPAPLDLSPVPEPADVVGLVRWTNPASTLSALTSCAGLPPQLSETGTRVVVEGILDELLPGSIEPKQLAPLVALDAPMFGVVALDPTSKRGKPFAAIAVGLTSLEAARGAVEAAGAPAEIAPGMWKIGGKERSQTSCVIAASAGSTPARLVCADRDRDLAALAPYLTRTLPSAPPEGRDMRGEVRFVPLIDKFGAMARQQLRGIPILAQSQATIGEPTFDKALMEAANAVTGELGALLNDADKLSFELGADPKTCLTLSGSLSLRGSSSWIGAGINDQARRTGAPPPLFWRVPRDSESAFFSHGADGTRFAPILKNLGDLLEGFLNKEKIAKPADRKALADLLRNVPLSKDVIAVSATGSGPQPAAGKGGKDNPQQILDQMMESVMGWSLTGVTEKPDAIVKWLKDGVAAYNRPGLLGPLKKELGNDAKLLPVVKTAAAPKELGKNGLAIEVTFKDIPSPKDELSGPGGAKAKPKTMSFTLHILVMGEEASTWLAIGSDKAELIRRLGMVKTGAPDTGSLSGRPGLEPLKSAKVSMGGYFTIAPLTRSVGGTLGAVLGMGGAAGAPPEARQAMNLLNNLPNKGDGPIFFTTHNRGGSAPHAQFSVNLTRPALEDIGALIVGGMKIAGALNP